MTAPPTRAAMDAAQRFRRATGIYDAYAKGNRVVVELTIARIDRFIELYQAAEEEDGPA